MKKKIIYSFEEEFDKEFGENEYFIGYRNGMKNSTFPNKEIKSFISHQKQLSFNEGYEKGILEESNKCYEHSQLSFNEALELVKKEKHELYKQLFQKINNMPMCIWHDKNELLDIIKIGLYTDNKKVE